MGIENFQFYHRLIEGDRTTNRCDRTTKTLWMDLTSGTLQQWVKINTQTAPCSCRLAYKHMCHQNNECYNHIKFYTQWL